MGGFAVCDACRRHIKANESQCPFCNATRTASPSARGPVAGLAAVAVTAVALAGCGPRPEPAYGVPQDAYPATDSDQPDERAQPAYGIVQDVFPPPQDSGSADAAQDAADDIRAQPAYGIVQDR